MDLNKLKSVRISPNARVKIINDLFPDFAEESPLTVTGPSVSPDPVNVPTFAFSGTEPIAFAQVEQMAVDMMR